MTQWWRMHRGLLSEANKYYQSGSVYWSWSLLDGYQQGLSPPVHSFNKSDLSDLGKRFNDCFLSVFSTVWVGGLTRMGRDGTLLCWAVNGCFGRTTNTFLFTIPDYVTLCIYMMVLNCLFCERVHWFPTDNILCSNFLEMLFDSCIFTALLEASTVFSFFSCIFYIR